MCCFSAQRMTRSDSTPDVTEHLGNTPKVHNATSCASTTEGGGHGWAAASDNDPIMCRSNRCDVCFVTAQRLTDPDIMPRYRMTPPARARRPPRENATAPQLALAKAEANGRSARLGPLA